MNDPNKKKNADEELEPKKLTLDSEELTLLDEGQLEDVDGGGPVGFPPGAAH